VGIRPHALAGEVPNKGVKRWHQQRHVAAPHLARRLLLAVVRMVEARAVGHQEQLLVVGRPARVLEGALVEVGGEQPLKRVADDHKLDHRRRVEHRSALLVVEGVQ